MKFSSDQGKLHVFGEVFPDDKVQCTIIIIIHGTFPSYFVGIIIDYITQSCTILDEIGQSREFLQQI